MIAYTDIFAGFYAFAEAAGPVSHSAKTRPASPTLALLTQAGLRFPVSLIHDHHASLLRPGPFACESLEDFSSAGVKVNLNIAESIPIDSTKIILRRRHPRHHNCANRMISFAITFISPRSGQPVLKEPKPHSRKIITPSEWYPPQRTRPATSSSPLWGTDKNATSLKEPGPLVHQHLW
jgi:hypothetical protein